MEWIVILSCIYSQGCEDSAHAYYITHPELKYIADNTEAKAESVLGKQGTLAIGTSTLFLSGRQWTYKITNNVVLKGENKWENLSLSYLYYF